MRPQRLAILAALSAFSCAALAQQYVFPAKGQSPDQQKKDEAACHTWAVDKSKYDPANPPQAAAPATPPTTATGTTPGAGVRGAARGAVAAEVVGGDAGKGAAVGAMASRSRSRQANAAAAEQGQQQAAQAQSAGQQQYAKARAACLEGKGYTVK